jgi:hypothetical protein
MIHVKDGDRTLQFNGALLGRSSSFRRDSLRWIEFELYKTESGSYVLSRVGVSVVYHSATCHLVKRYGLNEVATKSIDNPRDLVPCDSCSPSLAAGVVFPEKNRHWAQVSDDPSAVLEALYKYDESGARYLTNVAQRLLEEASKTDKAIEKVYRIEVIP